MSKCRVYTLHMAFESGIGDWRGKALALAWFVYHRDFVWHFSFQQPVLMDHHTTCKGHNIHIYKPCTKRKAFVSTNRNCGQNHKCGCCSMWQWLSIFNLCAPFCFCFAAARCLCNAIDLQRLLLCNGAPALSVAAFSCGTCVVFTFLVVICFAILLLCVFCLSFLRWYSTTFLLRCVISLSTCAIGTVK